MISAIMVQISHSVSSAWYLFYVYVCGDGG